VLRHSVHWADMTSNTKLSLVLAKISLAFHSVNVFCAFAKCFHFLLKKCLTVHTPVKNLLLKHVFYVPILCSHMWFCYLRWARVCEKVTGCCKTEHHWPLNPWSRWHSSNSSVKQPILFCPWKKVFTHGQEQNW